MDIIEKIDNELKIYRTIKSIDVALGLALSEVEKFVQDDGWPLDGFVKSTVCNFGLPYCDDVFR